MSIRINNITLEIDESLELLKGKAAKKLKIKPQYIKKIKILRESIDARRNAIRFNYTLEVVCENEKKIAAKANNKDIKMDMDENFESIEIGNKKMDNRPVIVGMGPAGMFAGLIMAKNGYKPIIIERGETVNKRTEAVNKFWNKGILDIDCNVQFGEGGAGTFSDGKLTTRIKDKRCDYVIEELIKAGAPEDIAYIGKPHVGTDILKIVVKNIREKIIAYGGEIHFNSKLKDINIIDNKIESILVNDLRIPCDNLIIAIGHSARDTYEMLYEKGVAMEAKPFAIGVRIEHLQSVIDENQYGKYAGHPRLKAADYRLTYTSKVTTRSIYSFCMCPGGEVVAAASEDNRLVTNGMSYYKRDKTNANSALVVTVTPEDFLSHVPLAGMEFQRYYEELAYKLGGGNYNAPICLIGDFLQDKVSSKLGKVKPTYKPGYEFRDLRQCLPSYVIESLKEGINVFGKKISGFSHNDGIITGIETRTSAPVRILRNENFHSINITGLFPAGEGAGYAGGIMSAAVDGMKVAERIMKEYTPIK